MHDRYSKTPLRSRGQGRRFINTFDNFPCKALGGLKKARFDGNDPAGSLDKALWVCLYVFYDYGDAISGYRHAPTENMGLYR